MKCPNCGSICRDGLKYCPVCSAPLTTAGPSEHEGKTLRFGKRTIELPWLTDGLVKGILKRLGVFLFVLAFLIGVIVGGTKISSWLRSYKLNRLYTRGAYKPALTTMDMEDLRHGHAVIFFGKDGDQIFLPELNRSLPISGGVARIEVADSDWFGSNVTGVDYADITLSPMLISEKGEETELPQFNFQIPVPESPLNVTSPASDKITVVTGVYPLTLNVVPGSTVYINGEDVTDSLDRSGYLSTNVTVRPIGDNVITLIVRTPKHRECRRELVIFRQQYDIELELDTTVSDRSSNKTMAVTGTAEPGAMISVDTDYIPESLSVDMETGRFSFIAKLSTIGDNVVRFRASKEGKDDAVISFNVYYLPTLADYSAKAWRMDYEGLRSLVEQWRGRIFLCTGEIIDIVTEDDTSYMIMDVGKDERQLVALQNLTSTKNPTPGRRYAVYADVSGQYMYQSQRYPLLIARYMDLAS